MFVTSHPHFLNITLALILPMEAILVFGMGIRWNVPYQPRVDPECVIAVGIRGQMLYVDRARRVVIAKQSSWDEADPEAMHKDSENACRAIARAVTLS